MPSGPLLEYRLRIRDAANTMDVLTVSSVRGDALPYIVEAPHGDGSEFDPLTGAYRSGSCTVRVADAVTSGTGSTTARVVTALLEDAAFRQQLASRPAYVEERVDGGAWSNIQAGLVTAVRLASAAVYEIDVGDTMRATRNLTAFAPKRNALDATQVEPLADYLARWPNRGCVVGGPVIGGFLGIVDLGGWEMRVADRAVYSTVTYTPSDGGPAVTETNRIAYLEYVAGYAAPLFRRGDRMKDIRDGANAALGPKQTVNSTTFPGDLEVGGGGGGWPDLVVQIGTGTYAAAPSPRDLSETAFLSDTRTTTGLFVWDSAQRLTVGARVRVRVFDALPSERCPIYYAGHPLDLWTKLCDEAGLAYDTAAVATCKDALGRNLRINLRITGPQSWASFVESTLYGPCGFSVRTDPAGRLVPFATRIMVSAPPALTLTSADVPQEETPLFELSEPDAITQLTVEQSNLLLAQAWDASAPLDGVAVQAVSVVRTSGDGGGPVQREQTYRIPGFLDTGSGAYEPALVDALARGVFDRYGRGRLTGEVTALRGGAGDAVTLGQEIVLALPAMPNHNKRYGDDATVGGRVVQVVRITQDPRGKRCRVVDSGPNAQPTSPLPALSVAAGTVLGASSCAVTNAATLNAAAIGVRLQWAQTSGAAPAAADYTDVAWFGYGAVPTATISLPIARPGATVFVRARSEQAGKRPSAYTASVSVATLTLGAPTGLTATPSPTDGTACALAWTIGANAAASLTDVFLRLASEPASANVRRATLLGGSISYPLNELTPGTSYTASVQHREPSGLTSPLATVTFTTSATAPTLPVPLRPVGIVGPTVSVGIPARTGIYGLDVTAAVLPGTIEVWEAVETAPVSGAYGTATLAATLAAVSGGPTSYRNVAPADNCRRQLTARHVSGTTSSGFTTPVTVDPWGPVMQPDRDAIVSPTLLAEPSENGATGLLFLTLVDPQQRAVAVEYASVPANADLPPMSAAIGAGGWLAAPAPVGSLYTLPDITLTEKQAVKVAWRLWGDLGAGPQVVDSGVERFALGARPIPPEVTYTIGTDGALVVTARGDSDTTVQQVVVSTVAAPTPAQIDAATGAGSSFLGRTAVYTHPTPIAPGQRFYVGARSYNGRLPGASLGPKGSSPTIQTDQWTGPSVSQAGVGIRSAVGVTERAITLSGITLSPHAARVEVYVRESTTDPTLASVEQTGHRPVGAPLVATGALILPVTKPQHYLLVTLVAVDLLGRVGQGEASGDVAAGSDPTTLPFAGRLTLKLRAAAAGAVTPPNAPTALTLSASGSDAVDLALTMPATELPDTLRIFRNGVALAPDVARTAAASAVQHVVDPGRTPGAAYQYQGYGVRGGVLSASGSPPQTITLAAVPLLQPALAVGAYDVPSGGFPITVTPGAGAPAGVLWTLEHSADGAAWSTVEQTTATTFLHSHARQSFAQTDYLRVAGTKSGYGPSPVSAVVATTVPNTGGADT